MQHKKGPLQDALKRQLALVRRRLLSRGRSRPHEVDELIQEGFLRLCRYQKERQVPVRDPVSFLVTVAERVRIDHARHDLLTKRLFCEVPPGECFSTDTRSSPETQAEVLEIIERIDHVLSKANPRTREIFLLHRFEGMRYVEIAERIGISTQAVTNHIAKALLLISNELSEK